MARILICIFLCGILTSCATSAKDEKRAELLLSSGTGYFLKGNYPAALRELLDAEKLDPKNPVIQNNLALVYLVRDRLELAEKHIRRALEISPKFADARNNLGRVLIEQGRIDEAIRELNIVLDDLTYGQPQKAYSNLGLAYFRKRNFTQARDKFAEAVKLQREDCLAQTYYGRSLFELGDFTNASITLDNAVELCKNAQPDEPQYFSGISYYKLGQTEKAVARMEEVIRVYPKGKYAKKAESMLQIMLK